MALITVLIGFFAAGCGVFGSPQKNDTPPNVQGHTAPEAKATVQENTQTERRAQEPVVAEILAEPITFDSLGDTLSGVIERPDTRQAPGPAVLILHATGPLDRGGHFKAGLGIELPMEVAVYEDLAQNLVRNGFMVMRYDKRTCVKGGRPWCTYPRSYIESQRANLAEALQADAAAAIATLRSDPRVDPSQIFVLGHGQGADLALALSKSEAPAGLLLLAPSPYPIDRVISHQIQTSLKHLHDERKKAGNTTQGTLLDQQIAALTKTDQLQSAGFKALRAGTFGKTDLLGAPAKTWTGLFKLHRRASEQLSERNAPILAIFGSHDGVLPRASAQAFGKKSRPKDPQTAHTLEIVELPQTTHFMIDIDAEADPRGVSELVQQQVLDFLETQARPSVQEASAAASLP